MNRLAKLLSAAMVMFAPAMSWSAEVTPEQACVAACNWIEKNPKRMTVKFASSMATEVKTSTNAKGRAIYHVVSLEGGGYVVTAGDTQLPPVIAFSESENLDLEDVGNPMLALLESDMSRRIEFVDDKKTYNVGQKVTKPQSINPFEEEWAELMNGTTGTVNEDSLGKNSLDSLSDVRVSPLVQSKWTQRSWNGYNTFNYYTPNNYACGCVATAFSQIMRYWQKPANSVTAQSRNCMVDNNLVQKSMYGGTYSWSNMPLTSSSCSSDSQRSAIGKLLYDVGVASQMNWTSTGSGTMGFACSHALKSVFGYASSQAYFDVTGFGLSGALSSQTDFRDAILASLDAGMPCAVGVGGSQGGHEMVLDGYGFSGSVIYSHINCGWNGSEDAWYNFFGEYVTSYSFAYMDELGYNIHPTTSGDVLSGRVLNSFGNPVSGATVTLTFGGTMRTTSTNAKGIYYFRISSAGTYAVSASYGSETGSTTASVTSMSVSTTAEYDSDCDYSRSANNGILGNKWGVDVTLGIDDQHPVNDNFANAERIYGARGSTTGSNVGATCEAGEPLRIYRSAATNTIWWVWTAPSSGTTTFSTTNTTFDTVMGVYTGTYVSSLTTIKEDDDGGANMTSSCTFSAVAGTTYYIAVSGYGASKQGTIRLYWNLEGTTPRIWWVNFHKNDPNGGADEKKQRFITGQSQRLLYLDSALKWSCKDKDGFSYIFLGWAKSKTGAVVYANGESVRDLVAAGKVLHVYAVWQKRAYNVCFHSNDGRNLSKMQEFRPNIAKNLLWLDSGLKWTRSGYDFLGWARSPSGGAVYANGQKAVNLANVGETLHLYAKWQDKNATYTVRFHKNDGTTTVADQVFKVGDTKPLTWVESGLGWSVQFGAYKCAFEGWARSSGGSVVYANGEKVHGLASAGSIVHLYAIWRIVLANGRMVHVVNGQIIQEDIVK